MTTGVESQFKAIPVKQTNGRSSKVSRSDFSELKSAKASKHLKKGRLSKEERTILSAYITEVEVDADRLFTPEV